MRKSHHARRLTTLALTAAAVLAAATPPAAATERAPLPASCVLDGNHPTCASGYISSGRDGKVTITADRIRGTGTITCQASGHGSNFGEVTSTGSTRSKTLTVGADVQVAVLGFNENNDEGVCKIS
ncbi:hypothetical protein GCM10010123_08110 [Pilimelia anulata]|uniref:Secreted protein n=1 Tax=Pilimelia anulata TaxID=53371 RepID=A0A8J3B4M3_9ACTN|nr:hypothetical protein [Pilimelia anulata]GGJ80551.1 hypothetical protein GCM10010123_08110 [Pilimelia anulata]